MRRYTSSQEFAVQNWPVEYKGTFSPLLSHLSYQAGSLRADSLEHALKGSTNIEALPPVLEVGWESYQKDNMLKDLVSSVICHEIHIISESTSC